MFYPIDARVRAAILSQFTRQKRLPSRYSYLALTFAQIRHSANKTLMSQITAASGKAAKPCATSTRCPASWREWKRNTSHSILPRSYVFLRFPLWSSYRFFTKNWPPLCTRKEEQLNIANLKASESVKDQTFYFYMVGRCSVCSSPDNRVVTLFLPWSVKCSGNIPIINSMKNNRIRIFPLSITVFRYVPRKISRFPETLVGF